MRTERLFVLRKASRMALLGRRKVQRCLRSAWRTLRFACAIL